MASNIDPTKPPSGPVAYTSDVRANFLAAKTEIEALQAAMGAAQDRLSEAEQRLEKLDGRTAKTEIERLQAEAAAAQDRLLAAEQRLAQPDGKN